MQPKVSTCLSNSQLIESFNLQSDQQINRTTTTFAVSKIVHCSKCYIKVDIKDAGFHRNNQCGESYIEYNFQKQNASNKLVPVIVKRSILNSIEQAHDLLNNTISVNTELERLHIYKTGIIAYNKLFNIFQREDHFYPRKPVTNIDYNTINEISNADIQQIKNKLFPKTINLNQETNTVSFNQKYIKYMQEVIDYQIKTLPEVKISRGNLLCIKKAEAIATNNLELINITEKIQLYQQALPVYKKLLDDLKINQKIKNKNIIEKNGIQSYDNSKVLISEKPLSLISQNPLQFFDKNINITGTLFSLSCIKNYNGKTIITLLDDIEYKHKVNDPIKKLGGEYVLEVNMNATPSYHTNDDCGIYFTATTRCGVSDNNRPIKKDKNKYKFTVSYIDRQNSKKNLFSVNIDIQELIDSFTDIDVFDKKTRFNCRHRSEGVKKLNRFFNSDGTGKKHVENYGYDSIFAFEWENIVVDNPIVSSNTFINKTADNSNNKYIPSLDIASNPKKNITTTNVSSYFSNTDTTMKKKQLELSNITNNTSLPDRNTTIKNNLTECTSPIDKFNIVPSSFSKFPYVNSQPSNSGYNPIAIKPIEEFNKNTKSIPTSNYNNMGDPLRDIATPKISKNMPHPQEKERQDTAIQYPNNLTNSAPLINNDNSNNQATTNKLDENFNIIPSFSSKLPYMNPPQTTSVYNPIKFKATEEFNKRIESKPVSYYDNRNPPLRSYANTGVNSSVNLQSEEVQEITKHYPNNPYSIKKNSDFNSRSKHLSKIRQVGYLP